MLTPRTGQELAEALASAAAAAQVIALGGNFTKRAMGGPLPPAEVTISTSGLARVLAYEPRDLTISLEAGVKFADARRLLAEHRQMLPLDPPFSEEATIGGIVAANTSGPRRRLYGAVRDMVIGMQFATLEGKLIQSGGLVVKNVAGLDMAKLMIGSFGTLAGIAVVNFRLAPQPLVSGSYLLHFDGLADACAARDRILRSVLQPVAIDLLNPQASVALGKGGCVLALQVAGNAAVIERWGRELPAAEALDAPAEETFWRRVQNFTPDFLARNPGGAVVRVSATLPQLEGVIASLAAPVVARAGTGVCWGYFSDVPSAQLWMKQACLPRGWKAVIEFAPPEQKDRLELWPAPGGDLEVMRRIKKLFDPQNLLNPGRLYGRI